MRRFPLAILALVLAASVLAAFVFNPVRAADPAPGAKPGSPAVGGPCVIYLRGDAVGQALNYVGSARGTPSVAGVLRSADDQWLAVEKDGKLTYVPRGAILMVDVNAK